MFLADVSRVDLIPEPTLECQILDVKVHRLGPHWETRSPLRMFHLFAVIAQERCFGLTYR